jgi:hypothetical protein
LTENKDKKKLTLGAKKLGLKLGNKLSVAAPDSIKSSQSGRVVVLKKNSKLSTKPSNYGSSNPELDKKMALIKKAEEEKKRAATARTLQDAAAEKAELQQREDAEAVAQEAVQVSEVSTTTVTNLEDKKRLQSKKPEKRVLSTINLDDLSRGNRVKNLDSMYKRERKVEDKDNGVLESQQSIIAKE